MDTVKATSLSDDAENAIRKRKGTKLIPNTLLTKKTVKV